MKEKQKQAKEKEKEEKEKAEECIICMDARRNIVYDCGHIIVCEKCAEQQTKCAVKVDGEIHVIAKNKGNPFIKNEDSSILFSTKVLSFNSLRNKKICSI